MSSILHMAVWSLLLNTQSYCVSLPSAVLRWRLQLQWFDTWSDQEERTSKRIATGKLHRYALHWSLGTKHIEWHCHAMLIFKKLPSKHFLMCFWTCSGSRACAERMILRSAKELISHYRSHYWNLCSRLYISGWEAIDLTPVRNHFNSKLQRCNMQAASKILIFSYIYVCIYIYYIHEKQSNL